MESMTENPWNYDDIADALNANTYDLKHSQLGKGTRFILREDVRVTFDVYPACRTVRVQVPDGEVIVRRVGSVTINGDQVVLEHEEPGKQLRHLSLTEDGSLTFLSVPLIPDELSEQDQAAYAASFDALRPPVTTDEYGFDDAEMRRLMDAGLDYRFVALDGPTLLKSD
jgi:hypothetical protein